jgi:hypothetical protein
VEITARPFEPDADHAAEGSDFFLKAIRLRMDFLLGDLVAVVS